MWELVKLGKKTKEFYPDVSLDEEMIILPLETEGDEYHI